VTLHGRVARVASCALLLATARLWGADDPADHLALALPSCDAVVRPPILFRLSVQSDIPPSLFAEGGWELSLALERDDEVLAADRIALAHLGALCDGVSAALAPIQTTRPLLDAPALLRVDLSSGDHRHLAHLVRALPTIGSLAGMLSREGAALAARAERDPLPWLWADQGAEIAGAGDSAERCRSLMQLLALLARADHGDIQRDKVLSAWRDPTDLSVQPERRYARALGAPEAWVLGAPAPAGACRKSDWPTLPSAWLSAADAADVAVVQPYPAGDAGWSGIALWRAERRLLATAHGRVALVGVGAGAGAALRLAVAHPELVAAVRLVDPVLDACTLADRDLAAAIAPLNVTQSGGAPTGLAAATTASPPPSDPDFWRGPAATQSAQPALPRALDPPASPLCAYARGPFVVVVGAGEHHAAQEDNGLLASQFVESWAAHAQGVPPRQRDDGFDPERWRGYTWVMVGNTRSNRAVAALGAQRLAACWDDRIVTILGASYLRCERRLVAFSLRRPDGGLAIILDGALPPARGSSLPLLGLCDPFIGPATPLAPAPSTP
jgi:pimeloyl-ACP methyl ester carboxylesterase